MLRPRVAVALTLVQVFFGVHYFAAKLILQVLPPRAWAALRISAAAALLFTWVLVFRRHKLPRGRDVARLALYAIFGVVINQVLFAEGLARTTPSHSAVINSLIPVATVGFAMLLGRERPTRGHLAALLLAFGSVLVLLRVERFRLDDQLVLGDLLTLANGGSFALFLVLSKDFLQRTDALGATAWLLLFGAVGILLVGGNALVRVDFSALPPGIWWLVAYAVMFATVLAYFLNYYALRHTESTLVALFIYLQPPIATALSMLFLGERPAPRFWVATAGIFAGVFLAVRDHAIRAAPAPQDGRSRPSGLRPAKPAS